MLKTKKYFIKLSFIFTIFLSISPHVDFPPTGLTVDYPPTGLC